MRLFISYARIDKTYCIRVVDVLNAHELWYDQRLYAGQNWWTEILRRLEWCDAFVYLLSPDSLASDYCHREFEIAQSLGKPIIPILIRKDTQIPEYLSDIQYIDISEDLTVEAVKTLLNTIYFIEHEYKEYMPMGPRRGNRHHLSGMPLDDEDDGDLITRAVDAMKEGNYDQAVFLLNRCKDLGIEPPFINIDALLKEAEHGLNDVIKQREMQRNYEQIRQLMDLESTRLLGIEAFCRFHAQHPDYDPENLSARCKAIAESEQANGVPEPPPKPANGTNGSNGSKPHAPQKGGHTPHKIIQPEWCRIPAGVVRFESDPDTHIHVDEFYISKYPITNAHYQKFLADPKGYNNISWWDFCGAATESRLQHGTPGEPSFKGQNRPRENVTWYDAMAFCRWLSSRLKKSITLPTLAQRQRAIQGDDECIYPWGDIFDPEYCNSQESELRMTTAVDRYEQGVSPYHVYDLVGNVWEWCLDDPGEDGDDNTLATAKKRIVHGGSYLSGSERCHVAFRYILPAQTLYSSIGFRVVLLLEPRRA